MNKRAFAVTFAFLVAGCAIGPDYERPPVELPGNLGVSSAATAVPDQWWKVFNDSVLDALVAEALDANRDLKAAAERVEQARAQFTVTRSDQFPQAGVEAVKTRDKGTALGDIARTRLAC